MNFTDKQKEYIRHYRRCGNHVEACRLAGYKNFASAAVINQKNKELQKLAHKKKDGRPRIEIDMEEMKKLCAIHCTQSEIAGWFGVSEDTIERRCGEMDLTFAEYFKQNSAGGKISLRRAQFQRATGGSDTMLIWLGKQYLSQVDGKNTEVSQVRENKDDILKNLSDEDLSIVEEILKKYDKENKQD